jgi:hypothetical protein
MLIIITINCYLGYIWNYYFKDKKTLSIIKALTKLVKHL